MSEEPLVLQEKMILKGMIIWMFLILGIVGPINSPGLASHSEIITLEISEDYTFTENIEGQIIVTADNLVIDGAGFNLFVKDSFSRFVWFLMFCRYASILFIRCHYSRKLRGYNRFICIKAPIMQCENITTVQLPTKA